MTYLGRREEENEQRDRWYRLVTRKHTRRSSTGSDSDSGSDPGTDLDPDLDLGEGEHQDKDKDEDADKKKDAGCGHRRRCGHSCGGANAGAYGTHHILQEVVALS